MSYIKERYTWWPGWLRHYVTSRKVCASIPDCVIAICNWHILLAALWPWGWLGLEQKYVQGIFPGGKGGRCIGLTLPPSRADCHEIWEPQPPGALRACPGLYRDCVTFIFYVKENKYLKQNLCPSVFCFVIRFGIFLDDCPVIHHT